MTPSTPNGSWTCTRWTGCAAHRTPPSGCMHRWTTSGRSWRAPGSRQSTGRSGKGGDHPIGWPCIGPSRRCCSPGWPLIPAPGDGELVALQLTDLDGDVLTIARGTSNEVVGPTKTGRIRRLTLGPTTAALWRHTVEQWRQRTGEGQRFGPWLFSRRVDHTTRLSNSCLAHGALTPGARPLRPHPGLPRGASAQCTALDSSQGVVAKRFSSGRAVLQGRDQPLHRSAVPGARRESEVRLPKQRRNPVTRLASHRSASLAGARRSVKGVR